jgi:aquaporin Z
MPMRDHLPEYLMELCCLGLFMVSAAGFATLLQHPASPLAGWLPPSGVRARLPMGIAMGLTAAALIYSPMGRRSGAHMNPSVTLTFLRLGKIAPADAWGYLAGQFAGGLLGIAGAVVLFGGLPAGPPVNYVATMPGRAGVAAAFVAEAAISFGMMWTVLAISNHARFARFTGLAAGALVALYITIEEPLSGMSMNPARTFGPAVLAARFENVWIYFVAPSLGMLLAAEAFVRRHAPARVRCAKLHHSMNVRCIFRCGYAGPMDVAS